MYAVPHHVPGCDFYPRAGQPVEVELAAPAQQVRLSRFHGGDDQAGSTSQP